MHVTSRLAALQIDYRVFINLQLYCSWGSDKETVFSTIRLECKRYYLVACRNAKKFASRCQNGPQDSFSPLQLQSSFFLSRPQLAFDWWLLKTAMIFLKRSQDSHYLCSNTLNEMSVRVFSDSQFLVESIRLRVNPRTHYWAVRRSCALYLLSLKWFV